MEKKIRFTGIVTVLALVVITAVSCGGGLSGKYSYTEDGVSVSFTFNSGEVKVTMEIEGFGEPMELGEGTYSVSGNKVTISMDGEPSSFTIENSRTLRMDDDPDFVLTKQ